MPDPTTETPLHAGPMPPPGATVADKPDHGENSYVGSAKLQGRAAGAVIPVTGGRPML